MILRENVQRRIVISCNVAGRDLGSVIDDIRSNIAQSVPMPAGYRVEYGGQFESQQSASRRLAVLFVGVIAGLFMLLVLAFGRARDAVIVMVNLPLALIGGVAGVFLAGGVLSVASMIGFITLFGIATRNGIMLVSHIQHLMNEEGVTDFREAVERGAHERLVPILMTAMAAGLALIPLALGGGKTGSEIQTPMAIVILCGLTTSTLLNMLVVADALYLRYDSETGWGRCWGRRKGGGRVARFPPTASDDSSASSCCDPPSAATSACSTSVPSRRPAVAAGRTDETKPDAAGIGCSALGTP